MAQKLVRVKMPDGAETTVGASFADSHGLRVLDKRAVNRRGEALPDKHPVDLAGKALDAALDEAGLPKSGTANEKRQRLADHQESVAEISGGEAPTNPGGDAAPSQED